MDLPRVDIDSPVILSSIVVIWLTHGVLDVVTTKILVSRYGLRVEGNPLMRAALHTDTFILMQLAVLTLLTLVIIVSRGVVGKTQAQVAGVITAVAGIALVMNNILYLF